MTAPEDADPVDLDGFLDVADGEPISLESRYERPDSDGVGALHDVEAESGDESGAVDLFSVDRRAAMEAGVALDTITDEPIID